MKTMHNTRRIAFSAMLMVMIICQAVPVLAQSGKYMYKKTKDSNWVVVDKIEFRSGMYRVTKGGHAIPLAKERVYAAVAPKPAHFDKWATALKNGTPDSEGIRGMESVVVSCQMLFWDVKALGYLFPAYESKRDYDKIYNACRKYEKVAGSLPGELQGYQLKAMIQLGKGSVQAKLDEAIASGTRDMVAAAYMAQGDLHRKRGRMDEAMYEGYLRVILCCSDVKSVQPEALYKAWETLKQKGDGRHEKFRAKLLADFRQSKYAKMMK